jgi:hypothetical protein
MTISLDLSDITNQVRVVIGDVETPYLLDDSVIDFLLSENNNNVNTVSLKSLQIIVASLAKKKDEEVGDVRVKWSQLYDHYRNLLDDLTKNPSMGASLSLHYFGGTTKSEIKRVTNSPETPKRPITSGYFTDICPTQRDLNNPYNVI